MRENVLKIGVLKLNSFKWVIYTVLQVVLTLACLSATAQIKGDADSALAVELDYVRWVSEYPASQSSQPKKGIIKGLGEFIFGKKTRVLIKPVSLIAESSKKFWVIDQKNSSIVLVEKNEGELVKIKLDDEQLLTSLIGFCEIPKRGLVISDSRLNKVFILENGSKKLMTLGDSIDWQQPTGLAYSVVNNEIWVLETKLHRISIINTNGELLKVFGKRGEGPGEFNYPTHIWIDAKGFAYVVDAMNFRVQIFNSKGEFVSMFGEAGDGTGYFARPKGIATDSHGNIYVVDGLFHNVQIFNRKGQLLYYFGSQGREEGQLWMPNGIYIDKDDYIFVADTYNSRVQIFKLINHE